VIERILLSQLLQKVLIVAIVGLAAFIAGHVRGVKVEREKALQQMLVIERARAEAEAVARERERRMQKEADNARVELSQALAKIAEQESRIRRLSADVRGLRDQISAYAAGPATGDSVAACRERAVNLGTLVAEGAELLVEGAGLLAACAADHDRRSAEVTALLRAWPRP
jgi:hypothetical protein